MLTYSNEGKNTKPVAMIQGGKNDGKIIFVNPDLKSGKALINTYLDFEDKHGLYDENELIPENDFEFAMLRKTQGKKVNPKEFKNILNKTKKEFKSMIGKEFMLCPSDDSKLVILPNPKRNDIFSAYGNAGSGKSTKANEVATNYRAMYPENNIFLFTRIKEKDDSIDFKKLGIQKIIIDHKLINFPFDYNEFKNSLVIFDDIDGIEDMYVGMGENGEKVGKKLLKKILQLQNDMIRLGREHQKGMGEISSFHIRHYLKEGIKTRKIQNGSTCTIIFPIGLINDHVNKFLNDIGASKKVANILREERWFAYCKGAPSYVFGEKFIYIL